MNPVLRQIFNWRMLLVFMMGFSSGLPLLLTGSTLKVWLTDLGTDLTTIGFFSLVGLPYTLKFLWAPLMDRYTPPFLGRRRGWAVITQLGVALSIAALGLHNPTGVTPALIALAALIAFFSASQDIVLDAYRREILSNEELGLGSSLFINGYRVGMLVAGALALSLADQVPWSVVYLAMAACLAIGVATVVFAPEPKIDRPPPRSMKEAVIAPFAEFFGRREALLIVAFILLYKLGDSMAADMTMPMYRQLGYSKTEIGLIVKGIGFWATIGGGLIGGILILRMGIYRALWVFGTLQAASTLGFSALAAVGIDHLVLSFVIGFENLAGGMGTAAYSAYMASLTNKRFTATQFALLSSLMGVPRVIMGSSTGWLAKQMGWPGFFLLCTVLAIPGMLLLFRVAPWSRHDEFETKQKKTA